MWSDRPHTAGPGIPRRHHVLVTKAQPILAWQQTHQPLGHSGFGAWSQVPLSGLLQVSVGENCPSGLFAVWGPSRE